MRSYYRHLLMLACILAIALGSLAAPVVPASIAQSVVPLYPSFVVEYPKLFDSGDAQFQISLTDAMSITIRAEQLACSANCLFELTPVGDNRQRFKPTKSSAGFPKGDSIFASYDLEAGDYALTVRFRRKVSFFDNQSLQFFRISYAPSDYTGPMRNLATGTDPRLWTSLQDTTLALQLRIENEISSTYIMNGDTWELSPVNFSRTVIGDRFFPRLLPGGKQLAIVEAANFGINDTGYRSWLAVYDLKAGKEGTNANLSYFISKQESLSRNEEYAGIAISPDGKLAVYHTNKGLGGDFEIAIMDLTTKQQRLLTVKGGKNRYPSFSPDGNRIVFHSDRDGGDYQVFSMKVDGTDVQQLTKGNGTNFRAVYSPDGQHIAFCSDRDQVGQFSDGSYYSQVYVMDVDGSNVQRLVDNSVDSCVETWSPDGQWIAYISQERPEAIAYAVSLDGTQDFRLARPMSFTIPEIKEGKAQSGMGVYSISWIGNTAKPQTSNTGNSDSGSSNNTASNDSVDSGNSAGSNDSAGNTQNTLLYEDELDSADKGGWNDLNEPPSTGSVKDGAYVVDLNNAASIGGVPLWTFRPGSSDWLKAPQPTIPFTLLVDVAEATCTTKGGDCSLGVVWGVAKKGGYSSFLYNPYNLSWTIKQRTKNGGLSPLENCTGRASSYINVFDSKPHQLRLDVQEKSIELKIDSQLIGVCREAVNGEGTIGFAVALSQNQAAHLEMKVDKVSVYNGILPN